MCTILGNNKGVCVACNLYFITIVGYVYGLAPSAMSQEIIVLHTLGVCNLGLCRNALFVSLLEVYVVIEISMIFLGQNLR